MKYSYSDRTGALRDTGGHHRERRAEPMPDIRARLNVDGSTTKGDKLLRKVPATLAWKYKVFPIEFDGETLTLATFNPDDVALADTLRFELGLGVRLVEAPRDALHRALYRSYPEGVGRGAGGDRSPERAHGLLERGGASVADERPLLSHVRVASPSETSRLKQGAHNGVDTTPNLGGAGMFWYTVDEGQQVMMRRPDGTFGVLVGPARVWQGRRRFSPMKHFVAHPGEFLIVRFRDGRQQHLAGPAELWFDPRKHLEVTSEDGLQISAKEAVVVYSKSEETGAITRRIEYGPALFVPAPGEWLHTFSWHASLGGSQGAEKVANALVFQKLWLMPDQMYHDVKDVRTADDAVLSIRLMIFFELLDIERMLEMTHDPIGDFVNAATSDTVEFTGKHDFESFKRNTDQLNEIETYKQLAGRASQCGYRINKVVYRGYGAAQSLQQMHDQAIEARTRLQLERATETQAQELENYKLESQLARSAKRRGEQTHEVEHQLGLDARRQIASIERDGARRSFERKQEELQAALRLEMERSEDERTRAHLGALKDLGVNLTAYLTQARADRLIEIRGGESTHLHLDSERGDTGAGGGMGSSED